MAVLESNSIFFFLFWYVKYTKYSINAIAPVTDIVLLTQNSEEESVNLIFPSICLYVHPHLNACVAIIQALTEPEETFMTVHLQFVQTGVLLCFSRGGFGLVLI